MRILVVSNLYPPDFLGGYELGCRQVVDALAAAGHDVRVLAGVPRSPVPPDPRVDRRLRLADVYDPYSQAASPRAVLAARQLEAHVVQPVNVHALVETLGGFRPDVVYFWNLIGLGGIGLMAAAQHLGHPWVMHVMDAVPKTLCALPFAVRPEAGAAFARELRGRYLCCSQTVLDEIVAGGVPIADQAAVVPNWVVARGTPDRAGYMPGGTLRVVQAGALSPSKGVDVLIRAAGLLRDRGQANLTVDLFGPGDDTPFRTLIHELDLADRVRLRGVRTQADLGRLYPGYDVFAFPTWEREPFAFAPLEAAARGCLTVIPRVCGNAEWMIDGLDCLKADRTPEGFADALGRVLDGTADLPGIARRGMRTVTRRFHLDAVLPRIERELAAAAAAPPARRGSGAEVYRIGLLADKVIQSLVYESFAA